MSRDQKVGLALGILLVGAVAAFFYRHEDVPTSQLPELKTAAELDRQISENPLAPYVQTPAAGQSGAPTRTPPVNTESSLEQQGLVPAPIALEPLESEASTRLASVSRTGVNSPSENMSIAGSISSGGDQKHVVQRGETLSSIAARYLGSSSRFEEIYEANRDRLRDANDLRIGQELRIPARQGRSSSAVAPSVSPSAPIPPTTSELPTESSTPLRFVPYPGVRGGTPTTPPPKLEASPNGATRRFSQLPPDDVIIRR